MSKRPSTLPQPYTRLARILRATALLQALFAPRNLPCRFAPLCTQLSAIAGTSVSIIDVRRVSAIAPNILLLSSFQDQDPELKVLGLKKQAASDDIKARVRLFEQVLARRVRSHRRQGESNEAFTERLDRLDQDLVNEQVAEEQKQLQAVTESKRQSLLSYIEIQSHPSTIDELLCRIQGSQDPFFAEKIGSVQIYPGRPPQYDSGKLVRSVPDTVLAAVEKVLKLSNVLLYKHQALSLEYLENDQDIVISTPTSSGKSLIYMLPILSTLVSCPEATMLLLFPTKALAQDQLGTIREMLIACGLMETECGCYDGDTSYGSRREMEGSCRVFLSNPDTLHYTLLPNWKRFERIFSNMKYVVVDEVHCYQGIFGSHVANIFSRLCRILPKKQVRFICCSATIANPSEFSSELIPDRTFASIDSSMDGSPKGPKAFVVWDITKCKSVAPVSAHYEAAQLLVRFLCWGLRTIVFCKSRNVCELILSYTKDILKERSNLSHKTNFKELAKAVACYRGGYSIESRRKLEQDLFDGTLRGVVSTCALELGIDIGNLDATIQVGFPGSVASFWQQAGRAGRNSHPSVSVYIGYSDPLDQFYVSNPRRLFEAAVEEAVCNAANAVIRSQHLLCAAFEKPIASNEFAESQDIIRDFLDKDWLACQSDQQLHLNSSGSWNESGTGYPSSLIKIRSISEERFQVVVRYSRRETVIDEIDHMKAFFTLYPGAVLLNQGIQYVVSKLDVQNRTAFVKKKKTSYYTKTRDQTDVNVLQMRLKRELLNGDAMLYVSEVLVSSQVYGYRKIEKKSGKVLETVDIHMPNMEFRSEAIWISIPLSLKKNIGDNFLRGTHAASHLLQAMLATEVICDGLTDLDVECISPHQQRFRPPRILVFDTTVGGSGICRAAFAEGKMERILRTCSEVLSRCKCESDTGCPSCVQSTRCSEYNVEMSKSAAFAIFEYLLHSN